MNQSRQLSVPGEFLGVSEEFASGSGTYEDADGRIYADVLGEKNEDAASRAVNVKARKLVRPLQQGDLVYARVDDLYESMVLLRFEPVVPANGPFSPAGNGAAFLRISELDNSYVERLQDFIRIGDIVKARVAEVKPLGIYLTIKDGDLGVLRAYCTRDRTEMVQEASDFRCPSCSRHETRKIPGVRPRPPSDGGRERGFGGRGAPRRNSSSRFRGERR